MSVTSNAISRQTFLPATVKRILAIIRLTSGSEVLSFQEIIETDVNIASFIVNYHTSMIMKPNILFILTDDQRYDTIGALGHPEIRTPHIDKLVSMGTTFRQAHIPGGTCGAICCPSRAMLHTGKTLFHLDGVGEQIPPAHTTMGEHFRNAGYTTFGTGKWHNGQESFNRSFSDGDHI
ncbi:MAG TPA: sulfatase-like hydrolase/transferase, partial [Oceanipulchritudo sp.]|nr:sulfatase-like hydrolase/transferase [Oceanipulchritudo sp.]